jgi:beta-lactamase regulating signal transducer with metallopeptidase domain
VKDFSFGSATTDPPALLTLLLDASVKGVVVLAVAGLVALCLRRASASARHLVWSVAMIALLGLPFLSLTTPLWQLSVLPHWLAAPRQHSAPAAVAPGDPEMSLRAPQADGASPRPLPSGSGDPTTFPWSLTLLLVWMIGVCAVAIRPVRALWVLSRKARQANRIASGPLIHLARKISQDLGLKRCPELLEVEPGSMPGTWGVLRPVVVLPADATTWSSEVCRIVLLHELAHVKRRDVLTRLLAQAACALYWFNLLVWLANRALWQLSERAADDCVLRAQVIPSVYASRLFEIVVSRRSAPSHPLGVATMAGPTEFLSRIVDILDPDKSRRQMSAWQKLVSFLVLTGLVVLLCTFRLAAGHVRADDPGRQASSGAQEMLLGDPLVPLRVAPRYGQANEIGYLADYGYDTARDIARIVTALSTVPSSRADMKIAFGQRDGGESAMNVAKGLGIGFGGPTAVHLLGNFSINNFGGLGGGL